MCPQTRAYNIKQWTDAEDFLSQHARLTGKLLKGGDPDLNIAARMVLYDWQRGKIPFFTLPPGHTDEKPQKMKAAADEAAEVVPELAVTEEDAQTEVGARAENAAAAAQAVRDWQALCMSPARGPFFFPRLLYVCMSVSLPLGARQAFCIRILRPGAIGILCSF